MKQQRDDIFPAFSQRRNEYRNDIQPIIEVRPEFSLRQGNDLITPHPEFDFPGLKPGDRWCLCAARWREALEAGCAPKVVLRATHQRALEYVSLEDLKRHAIDLS